MKIVHIVSVTCVSVLLSGCLGDLSNARGWQPQQKASGLDKTIYTGAGQKIGIIEPKVSNKDWDQVKGRLEYGIKLSSDGQGGDFKNEKIVKHSTKDADHADMVTSISIGKDYGIAPEAKAIAYQVDTPQVEQHGPDKLDITEIYKHAKDENLVAISNSWGFLPHTTYTGVTGVKEVDSKLTQKGRDLSNAVRSLLYDAKDDDGVLDEQRNPELRMVLCTSYTDAINSGKKIYTGTYDEIIDKDGNVIGEKLNITKTMKRQISAADLQALYDIQCKGGYDSKVSEAAYETHYGKGFIEGLKDDRDNNRDAPIWVWAAGNRADANPVFAGSLPGRFSEIKYFSGKKEITKAECENDKENCQESKIEDYWLAVAAIDNSEDNSNGEIYKRAWYSGRCGKAKKYCLAAVVNGGKHVQPDGKLGDNQGTSAAAPVVAGAMAVVKQMFKGQGKDNRWVRQRILASARHETADGKKLHDVNEKEIVPDKNGYSDEFGRGILRVDLATRSIGPSGLPTSGINLYSAQKFDVRNSFVQSSSVFGDGLSLGFSHVDTFTLDSMGAGFAYNMGDNIRTTAPSNNNTFFDFDKTAYTPKSYPVGNGTIAFIETTAQRFDNLEYTEHNMPFADTTTKPIQLAYRHSDSLSFISRFNAEKPQGEKVDKRAFTTQLSYQKPQQNTIVNIGIHTEQGTVLGASFAGAYGGLGRTHTAYVNRKHVTHKNGWDIRYDATASATTTNGTATRAITNISGLIASSFSVMAHRKTPQGTFGIALYQPLRLERGSMDVTFVNRISGDSYNPDLSYGTQTISPTPSGRQVSLEAYYDFDSTPWTVKTKISKDHGHIRNNNDSTILFKYFLPFR